MAIPIKDNQYINLWLREQNIRRKLQVLVSDQFSSPITYGIFKPKIILPKFIDFSNEQELTHVLAHEFVHIRRNDILTKLILLVALCIHWFNPFVWVMVILMNRDIEIICDNETIKVIGNKSKADYAMSLLHLTVQKGNTHFIYSSFNKNAIEERINIIMKNKTKKLSLFAFALTFLLILGSTAVLATTEDVILLEPDDFIHINTYNEKDASAFSVMDIKSPSKENNTIMTKFNSVNGDTFYDIIPHVHLTEADITVGRDSIESNSAPYYLDVEDYVYTQYGSIPNKIKATITKDGYEYSGTLSLDHYDYSSSTDKYTGYYSGRLSRI